MQFESLKGLGVSTVDAKAWLYRYLEGMDIVWFGPAVGTA